MSDLHRAIREQLSESCRVKESFSDALIAGIAQFAEKSATCLHAGGKLVLFGNGGSAADAQHLAAELVVRLGAERPGLCAIALTANASILTAAANDYGYERVFARQIDALVNQADLAVALSTSGNSPNIVAGVRAATSRGAWRVALTGESGGKLNSEVDLLLNVPSANPQRIQEAHITIGHIVCGMIEKILFNV